MTPLSWLLIVCCLSYSFSEVGSVVLGAGSSLPNHAYQNALFAYGLQDGSATIHYDPIGPFQGKCRIMSGLGTGCDTNDSSVLESVDFAASESILTHTDYASVQDLQLYPTLAAAIVPIFNLQSIKDLVLTPSTLARIFSGHVQYWDDPEITALNSDFVGNTLLMGRPIEVVVSSEDDGTTVIFKRALATFDANFSAEVGTGTASPWGKLNLTANGSPHMYVLLKPFALGYTTLDLAEDFGLSVAQLLKATGPVIASLASTQYALLELGLTFGNNGDAPEHLTADLHNAEGVDAWPIVGYTYIILRKSTLRTGATCEDVHQMANFWMWFWQSEDVARFAELHNLLPLPDVVQGIVIQRFRKDITCNGQAVWKDETVVVGAAGVEWLEDVFVRTAIMYHMVDPNVEVTYTSSDVNTEEDVEQQLDSVMFYVSDIKWDHMKVHKGVKLTLAGIGFVIISHFSLVLDVPTLAKIFDGTITTWLHPEILVLNPNGIKDGQGVAIDDKMQPIVLMRGPWTIDDTLEDQLKKYFPSYTGAGMRAAVAYDEEMMLRSAVTITRFALSATILMDDFDPNLQFATIQRQDGNKIAPNWQSILACATDDVYNAETFDYQLQGSKDPGCYPFPVATYLTIRKSECNMETDASHTAAVAFVEWLFSNENFDSALQQQNIAPLCFLPHIKEKNALALQKVTCDVQLGSIASNLWWIILVSVVAVVMVIGIGSGVICWKSTANMRAMRKQFSNDNVAQECAQAIAEFNLEAVSWLRNVPNPNKIQQSFLQIVRLLTEVRPFIPDQLLASLTRRVENSEAETDYETELKVMPTSTRDLLPVQKARNIATRASTFKSGTSVSSDPSIVVPSSSGTPSSRRQVSISKNAASEWSKKRCVYMMVHFSFSEDFVDPAEVGQLFSDIVTIGKGHGATIGQATFNSVIFHWGVVKHVAGSPLQAIMAAMEICALRLTLVPELRQCFVLHIGIAHGMCDVATVSAAGHCFFVVGGPEVNLATKLANAAVGAPLECHILITQAVYQEVQFSVHCMPRVWFNDVLLYEPMQLRGGPGHVDEWMYELKDMDLEETSFSSNTLMDLFQMIHAGKPATDVRTEVNRIKQLFGSEMTAHDRLCLDHLLRTV